MFVVIRARNCPDHLHGYLARFMLEADTNLFVSKMSTRVADNLWERISGSDDPDVSFVMIGTSNSEQGYVLKVHGGNTEVFENDGFFSIAEKTRENPCK